VDIKQAKKLVDKYYGDWQRTEPYAAQIMAEPPQTAERTQGFAWKDNETPPLLSIAYHTPTARDNFETTATLNVINELLFSRSGRLTKLLKNTLSLVESIDGSNQMHKDPTLETINVRLKRGGSIERVRDSIYSAIEILKNTSVSTEELDRARNNLRAQMIYQLDRPSRIAGSIGFYHVMTGEYKGLLKLYDAYSSVTPEKVRSVANEFLGKQNRTVVTLAPKSGI
jgi:zinc protease